MKPGTLVFESENGGSTVRVYADERGILVDTHAGALLLTDWATWLLVQVFSMGTTPDERWKVWSAAASALPEGDPT